MNIFKKLFPFHNPFKLKKIIDPYYGPNKHFWKKFKWWSLRIVLGLLGFIIILFAWFAKDLPTPGKIKQRQAVASSQIFDRNGNALYSFHGEVRRVVIADEQIPEHMKEAALTAEDRSFYRHFGFNLKGILRAAYNNLFRKTNYISGGSTITQQYVKNSMLTSKKTFVRKIKELILSIELEIMYSKKDILTMYLNEIPWGSNAYGVEAASNIYFNKSAKDLSLAEAATLAAMIRAPSYYSPYGIHPDKREIRTNYVLDSMVELGHITADEAERAKLEAKNLTFTEPKESITAPHFVMYVKEKLIEKYGEQMVEEGGLKVTTTLDLDKQKLAESSVKEAAEGRLSGINASNAALVAIDPKTGQILSMVGSADFFNKDIDGQVNVAIRPRQPGSSFKPIVYAAAFKGKYNPGYVLWDVTTDFGGYTPKNYDGTTKGPVTMRNALAWSLNIPAVKTLYLAGLDKSLETAKDMGITSLTDRDRYGLALVLGGGEVTLEQLTGAYGVFANQGIYAKTTPILKVEDSRGKVLEEYKLDENNALDPQIAYEIANVLSDNDARSAVFGSNSALYLGDRPAGAKTGTTSEYRDAWTVGFTPQLVAGVWVGNNNNSPMVAGSAGAMAAAPIWNKFMKGALEGQSVEQFVRPTQIKDITVDKLSNKLPTDNSPETITDIFADWQVPKERDDIHLKIKIDKFTGKKATDDCPVAFTEEKTFTNLRSEVPENPNWENPVRDAAKEYGITIDYPPSETSCTGLSAKPDINIVSPSNNAAVSANFTIKTSVAASAGIVKVEFYVDNSLVGVDSSADFTANVSGLTKGKHRISVTAFSASGLTNSDSIAVTVIGDKDAPNEVSSVSIQGGSESAVLNWTNPTDSDLSKVKIYVSATQGSLGNLNTTVDVSPSSNSSATINNLISGKTYWFTLRTVDSSSNENKTTNQYSANIN
jgi:1A family penicillin-binding protein